MRLYQIAFQIPGSIRSPFLEPGIPAAFAHEGKIHGFELAKYVFL